MDAQGSLPAAKPTRDPPFQRGKLGGFDAAVAAAVLEAAGDIAMLVDRHGVIVDLALSNDAMERDGVRSWLEQRWSDTVSQESRHKVEALLRDAVNGKGSQWREVNQVTPRHNSMMMRYIALDAGHDGDVIAIGRDDRAVAIAQNRLLEAQQATERDYARLRDADTRYRLLMQMSAEAILIVDGATKRITEANPAAERFIGESKSKLVGERFAKVFDARSQDEATSLLTAAPSNEATTRAQLRLPNGAGEFAVSTSLFRQGGATHCLVRMAPASWNDPAVAAPGTQLPAVIELMPDAFLITDADLRILSINNAFLDLVRIATKEQVAGRSLSEFLGRAGLDRNLLADNLREHGSVRNFGTILRDRYDDAEDVEVSAVSVLDGSDTHFGFAIRPSSRRGVERSQDAPDLRRSVEQLTQLVGRVKLKELVRETTDLVERLCIEAALELTKDNRASAAEVLGLSRQSLYSKLHRFGLGQLTDNDN